MDRLPWEAEASQHRLKEARANQEFVTAELQRAKEVGRWAVGLDCHDAQAFRG